jgi:hypothetical protein
MGDSPAVEVVQFKLAGGVDEKAFLEASDAMMPELGKLSGFITRELLKGEDEWMDIVHWNSLDEARQAAAKVMSIPACLRFFEMIDQSGLKVSHLEQARSY